jgi:hypothetical protein
MKPNWEKPELIVLRKGQSQEAVLVVCKAVVVAGDPQVDMPGQFCGNPKAGSCQSCQSRPQNS